MSNRDFKNTQRTGSRSRAQTSTKSSGKGGGGVMAGVLVGLIIGVAVVVGAVMYFNRATTPFSNLQKLERRSQAASLPATEVLAPVVGGKLSDAKPEAPAPAQSAPQPPAPVGIDSSAVAPAPQPAPARQNGRQDGARADSAKQDQQEFDFYKILPGKLDAVPGQDNAKSAPAAPASKQIYLQVGAFQHESEADNLKAKLALIGVEAKIQSVNVPDKGLLHRVRVGPFSRSEELDRMRSQLKQNGLDASIVKADNS